LKRDNLAGKRKISMSLVAARAHGEVARKSFKGDLPHDWIRLCAYWSAMPDTKKMIVDVAKSPFCKRNTVLCSKHAAELEGMPKPPDSMWKAV